MIPWVDNLVTQYADSKRQIEAYRRQINTEDLPGQLEHETVSGMIADLQYAIDWMRIGRKPHLYRGVDKTNVYRKNEVLKNMDLYPSLELDVEDRQLTDEQKMRLADILLALSERERQCYILHMAYGLTITEISTELILKRATVQKFIQRAKDKIGKIS